MYVCVGQWCLQVGMPVPLTGVYAANVSNYVEQCYVQVCHHPLQVCR